MNTDSTAGPRASQNAIATQKKKQKEDDELEVVDDNDLDEFFEESDEFPGDRRRDPLRR